MAQIAIPIVIAGALYLMSNDESKKENFLNIADQGDAKNETSLLAVESDDYYATPTKTELNMNNEGQYSQYQDKYFILDKNNQTYSKNEFKSLTGNMMTFDKINHNNEQIFYRNKSYGIDSQNKYNNQTSTLDNYTGSGSLHIDKSEVGSLFKPQTNLQNVYGNQNQNDFYQSRINESSRHANTKPWEEIKDRAGVDGFNWSMADRERTMPKNVDEMRIATNPKASYENNYVAPQYDPKRADPTFGQGKVIKKTPDKAFINYGQFTGNAHGMERPMEHSTQMLTNEERDTTSVSYYGVKGNQLESQGYVDKGEESYVHKQQLSDLPVLNLTNQNIYPATEQNYGKEGFHSYDNNRGNQNEFMGAIKGMFMANVVNPVFKGLKHTRKTNLEGNPNPYGNFAGNKKHIVYNPNEHLPVTNREMNVEKIGMNHLNVNRNQNSDGYMVANPYLPGTQKDDFHNEVIGIATGVRQNKSYEAEYNQRSYEKVGVSNYAPNGGTSLFNNQSNYSLNERNVTNNYTPLSIIPSSSPNATHIGINTVEPQQYKNIANDYFSPDILQAFKSNPYTKPIGSVA
jgi:hypothetical protein